MVVGAEGAGIDNFPSQQGPQSEIPRALTVKKLFMGSTVRDFPGLTLGVTRITYHTYAIIPEKKSYYVILNLTYCHVRNSYYVMSASKPQSHLSLRRTPKSQEQIPVPSPSPKSSLLYGALMI
jgi:hypothetical protein